VLGLALAGLKSHRNKLHAACDTLAIIEVLNQIELRRGPPSDLMKKVGA
jgi:hypothetical protein